MMNKRMIVNSKNLKYFLLIVIIPILGIIFMFSYGVLYVKSEINFAKKELLGLSQIYHLQYVILNVQKIRGLSNIKENNNKTINTITRLKKDINNYINQYLSNTNLAIYNSSVRKNFHMLLNSIQNRDLENLNFDQLSTIVDQSIILIGHVLNYSNLALDSKLKSYIMINSLISVLPNIVEYNGQIRGISSSIVNHTLTKSKRNEILIQLAKAEEHFKELESNIFMLKQFDDFTDIVTLYTNVKIAEKNIIEFTNNEILNKKRVMLNPNDIFTFTSNNTDEIVNLYVAIAKELKIILKSRIKQKERIILYLVFFGFASCIFILYINRLFYKKNEDYIKIIEELTIKDSMTSLYNRRHFDIEFEKQINIQKRAKENLIFIILDVDFFKLYNDTYGHHAGDNALISVAKTLKLSLQRASDMAFRLGGEEFGTLCSNMDEYKTLKLANKIRQNIEDLKIEHSKNKVSSYVTISLGIIVIEPNCDCTVDALYKAADSALYEAKNSGRNSVSIGIC